MTLPRFFCPIPIKNNATVTLPASVAHHAGRALRLREGVRIVLFNGKGGEYEGVLRFNKGEAQAEIDCFRDTNRNLSAKITLVQALASGDKMDWIIEKAVEMGVSQFIPIQAERSVLQLSGARLEKRQLHWQSIIQSASEQCGRNTLMALTPVVALKDCFVFLQDTLKLVADPEATQSLTTVLSEQKPHSLSFFIGPEGGWSSKEINTILQQDALAIRFGERILRTETAGIALVSASASLLNLI